MKDMRGFTKQEKEQAQKEANEAIARLKKSQAKYISRPIDKKNWKRLVEVFQRKQRGENVG